MARLTFFESLPIRPFKALKRFLPATLLGRSLLILIAPVILVQLIVGIVFWDRHWSKTTDTLAEGIAGDVSSLVEMAQEGSQDAVLFARLADSAMRHHNLSMARFPAEQGFSKRVLRKSDWRDFFLQDALQAKMSHPFRVHIYDKDIIVQVATQKYIYSFDIQKNYLFPKTTSLVIWWEVGAPLFFIFIAVLFMRNQVRPLQLLASAVEAFGKGQTVREFKPAGALEVRRVGRAFNEMRERIRRQITQRTEMLAGISHDLKTPLTRMELQLALLPDSEEKDALLEDVKEMEKMVEEYLAFAKGQEAEHPQRVDARPFIDQVFAKFSPGTVTCQPLGALTPVSIVVRPHSLKRALKNLAGNALRYGTHVWFSASVTPRTLTLVFEDNGPGIPEDKREDVFRPFVRLDESRNAETGGYGLGLSIARDIILGHGGSIFLDDSQEHGGLKVIVNLPV